MISKFSVKKPYTVLVGVILIIVLGVVSFTRMSADLLPDINLPYVVVMTTYVGASPETVETAVTVPVESQMATVNNIKSIQSMSSENYSVVILEFEQTADMDSVSLDMREKLDQLKSYWPDTVGNPMIMKINPNMLPAMIAAVGVEGMTNTEISEFASDKIIPALESLEGVASVNATGLIEESVHIVIREEKVEAINEKLYKLIDEKFEEAYEKIAEAKDEIEKGEAELNKAEKELKNGEAKINSAKTELANGRTELENKKKETIDQLTNAKLQVLSGKADLEAAKIQITTNLQLAGQLADGIKNIEQKISEEDNSINQIQAPSIQNPTQLIYFDAVQNAMEKYSAAKAGYEAGTVSEEDYLAAKNAADELKTSLTSGTLSYVLSEDVRNKISNIDFSSDGAYQEYSEIMNDYVNRLVSQRNENLATLPTLKDQLDKITGGISVDEVYTSFTNAQYEALNAINSNIKMLDEKIVELYKGESEALVQFSNGLSKIDLAEYQLDASKAQLESGKAEIKNGKDSIQNAKDQLADSEEEIETQKVDAKEAADMTGVLTVDLVTQLLSAQNFSMPAGYIEEGEDRYLVRIGDKPDDVDSLAAIPLIKFPMTDDDIITLSDVADVFVTSNAGEVYTNVNGHPGVILSLQKQTGYSTGDVSDTINKAFEKLQNQYDNLTLIPLMDQGIYIDLVMSSIFENVFIGGALAILILIFFLKDIRPTLIIAISIPVSLIAAIVAMYFSGVTLNIISLSGLALGVGMLVDNSIVVIENIYRMRNLGMDAKTASIEGSKEVAGAIFASTLTTVSVFLPIVFTEGITRQLFVDMGLTIAYSLLASLLIALTVVPALASKSLRKVKDQKERKEGIFLRGYRKFLTLSLKVKPLVILLAMGLLAASILVELQRGVAYFPEMESTQIEVGISLSKDSPLTTVGEETDKVISRIMELDDVVDIGAMASSSSLSMLGGRSTSSSETTRTSIYVITKEDRTMTSDELANAIRDCGKDIEGIDIFVQTSTMDMSALGGSGITINIKGRDIDTLFELGKEAADVLRNTEGIKEVSGDTNETDPEFRITVDKDKAVKYGLTVAQVFAQIYPHFQDATSAATLVTGTDDLSIYVEDNKDDEFTLAKLKIMPIEYKNDDGKTETIPLYKIAKFKNAVGLSTINRKDQSRIITINASLAEGYNIGLVAQAAEENMKSVTVPAGYSLSFAGENETIMESLSQLVLMLILAVVFIYLIMVAQFQSLLSPFIIMFTIPLAFTGGFAALYFTNNEISIVSMIGFVMLSGIIVNNGIVLVDYINQRREAGMSKKEAIIDAGVTRLRPVLMTALTTILALLTMAFSKKMGADMTKPLAIVVIGGMIYGTLMTLVIVPCIYDIFMREKKPKNSGDNLDVTTNHITKGDDTEPVLVTLDENDNIVEDIPNPEAVIKIPKGANFEIKEFSHEKEKCKDTSENKDIYESNNAYDSKDTFENKDVYGDKDTYGNKDTYDNKNTYTNKDTYDNMNTYESKKEIVKDSFVNIPEKKHPSKKNPYMVGWNV